MQKRYPALDALRGVAAILVVCHHLQRNLGVYGLFERGFLAVDFFFMLSGFVIARAYEDRLQHQMDFWTFARTRLVRIYPMIFAGVLVGAAVALRLHPDQPLGLALASQLLLLPGLAGGGALFLLNSAHWSIVFELAANAAHALGLRWLKTRLLAAWLVLSGAALIVTAWKFGNLGGGWGSANWIVGLVRVGFSYPLGIFAWRLLKAGKLPTIALPFPVVAALLVGAILGATKAHSWTADATSVLVVFPALLWLGIGCQTASAAEWLGAISYPLYAIHEPLTRLWAALAPHTVASGALTVVGCLLAAWAFDVAYDRPVRAYLNRLLMARPARLPAGHPETP